MIEQSPASAIVIRPPAGWSALKLGDLWEYRELLYFLGKREIQVRYKQSLFGVSWAIMQPVALAFIFTVFFGVLADIPSEGFPYPVFALAGLVPWLFISQTTSQSALSMVGESNLLSKVYFPRLVLPLAKTLALLLDFTLALVVLIVVALLYGIGIGPEILTLPLFLVLAVVTALGIGVLLSAINVEYRDVAVAVPLMIQTWLFATPVIYPGSLVEGAWRYVYALNPAVSVVDGVRWALLGARAPEVEVVAISTAVAVGCLCVALAYFRKTEQFFADVV